MRRTYEFDEAINIMGRILERAVADRSDDSWRADAERMVKAWKRGDIVMHREDCCEHSRGCEHYVPGIHELLGM